MLRITPALLAIALLSSVAGSPASAAGNCFTGGSGPGAMFQFGSHMSEERRLEYVKQYLRQRGVDTYLVERWSGCYRAYVRDELGEHWEFFNADTLERVD